MELLKQFYYTPLVLMILNVLLVIVGTIIYKRLQSLRIFYYYSILAALQSTSSVLVQTTNIFNLLETNFIEIFVNLFGLIEFLAFSYFAFHTLNRIEFRNAVKYASISFTIVTIAFWSFNAQEDFLSPADKLTVIGNIIMLNYPLLYFYEILTETPVKSLSKDPTFWFMVGIFILAGLLIPQFLIRTKIFHLFPAIYGMIYSMTFVAYSLMYLCFLNAFVWQAKAHK